MLPDLLTVPRTLVYERGVNERIILGEMIMTCCKLLLLTINHYSKSFRVFRE